MSAPVGFDVTGPLPAGVTVLEASAGTGKTYTIAALAARYVADGVPLHELLLVTFTRMATGELRERVRERLAGAEAALAAVLGGSEPGDDAVVRVLAAGRREDVALRHRRLVGALADFDAATIATTHGFCLEALSGLGITGDVERDAAVSQDAFDLLDEVVDDLYVRKFHRQEHTPEFDRSEALRIARIAVANPAAPIAPQGPGEDPTAAMRRGLAAKVREELEARKRRLGVITYDDLLTRLDATLAGPGGTSAAARLRARYGVVLVDEFQDTDPVQWDIMRRAFAEPLPGVDDDPRRALVLIGDPKQAIYAFRGADVYAYLDAAHHAGAQSTLRTNWRSDQSLVTALDTMFGGARLGHDEIVYRTVEAVPAHREPRLHGAPVDAALRLRVVHRDDPSVGTTRGGYAKTAEAREHVARDVAAEVVALLSSQAEIEDRAEDGTTRERRPVEPGDVAVLVRTHRQASIVHDALCRVGVPAVINGAGSVFATDPAREWLRLLEALERPTSAPRARAVALTCFLGWSTAAVAAADEAAWEVVHRRLHGWARVLRVHGVASLAEAITLAEGLPARVLAQTDGERRMTDLRHVGQLLHAAATAERLGPAALTAWLRARVRAAAEETGDEERSRRLESDADAVQVLTIHRSKGLEFPVVHCPFLWDPIWQPDRSDPVAFHDPDNRDVRTIDVALVGEAYERHRVQEVVEDRGEDLRLAYVALTRARHQAVIWWAGSYDSRKSALSRLVFARGDDDRVAPEALGVHGDVAATRRFEELAAQAPGCIAVEYSELRAPRAWTPDPPEDAPLTAARFARPLDLRWRRTSYSAIVAGAHEAGVASEPEEDVLDDEAADDAVLPAVLLPGPDEAALRAVPSPLGAMPSGVHVGTFVHAVLEAADYAAADLDAELAGRVADRLARRPLEIGDPAAVVAGLRGVLETPLGPSVDGLRLRDVARADRLDELAFELPLAGGDHPSGRLALASVADVLRAHVPAGDPLHGYADRLGDERLARELRGYLTGSIDLVLRLPDGRFAIADHKTNWLGVPGEELSAWHHRPAVLTATMHRAHYALQALLYTVALHRYLRWRLAGYDPDRHLAGVLYLFLRGMTGADTPTVDGRPCGVFAWQPTGALVTALSDVLDEGEAAA